MQNTRIWLLVGMAALVACSEAADLSPDAGEATTADAGANGSDGGSGVITGGDSGSSVPIDDASTGGVVLNEICGKGDNWIELVNTTSTAVDITDYAVADTEKDGGGPKASKAVAFPHGTVLSPNSYLIVAGSSGDAGSVCPDGGQSYCFSATWGISNKDGEDIFLLAPGGSIAEKASYPAATLNDGQTWGRLPNGTGAFTTSGASPGATNHAP